LDIIFDDMEVTSFIPDPDLTLKGYGCAVHYRDTSTADRVSYSLFGMTLPQSCPICGSNDMKDKGSYDKCMGCGERLTMEFIERMIITSG